MEANLLFQMSYFPQHFPCMSLKILPDVTLVRSEIPNTNFNYVMNAQFTTDSLKESVLKTMGEFQGTPFAWWIAEKQGSKELVNCLKTLGFSMKEPEVGMSLSLENFSSDQQGLHVKKVSDLQGLKDFSHVMVSLGEYPFVYDHFFSKMPPRLYQEEAPVELYVAYHNQVPITTGIVVFHANVGGIYYIMTCPSYRQKGYATKMTLFLLHQIKLRGMNMATLQASPMGKSLYQKLGFIPMCQFIEGVYHG